MTIEERIANARIVSNQDLDDNEYINYELFFFEKFKYFVKNNFIKSTVNKFAFLKEEYNE